MELIYYFIDLRTNLSKQMTMVDYTLVAALSTLLGIWGLTSYKDSNLRISRPPFVPSTIPFVGQIAAYLGEPMEFVMECYKKYGSVFSFNILTARFTVLVGQEASETFFKTHTKYLNASNAYKPVTNPIFGEEMGHAKFHQQLISLKSILNIEKYREYTPIVEDQILYCLRKLEDKGQRDMYQFTMTVASLESGASLFGPILRKHFDESAVPLLSFLSHSLTPVGLVLPSWMIYPFFWKLRKVRKQIKERVNLAYEEKQKEIDSGNDIGDGLGHFMNYRYKNGEKMTKNEILDILILLVASAIHTTGIVSTWALHYISQDEKWQDAIYNEQKEVFGDELAPIEYDKLDQCTVLDRVVKETLRLRPPSVMLLRSCEIPVTVKGMTIPKGDIVCCAPYVNHRIETWGDDREEFNPDRFLEYDMTKPNNCEYVPFGRGIHLCTGQQFGTLSLRMIVATMVRHFTFERPPNYNATVDFSTIIPRPKNVHLIYERRPTSTL
ncbi:unnamed protein product [Owenia fusiformis]|uniref:Cytochrome P450 n=1 Tax=Owenia fusiformis TaxID=6347 RepID=A0A8S4PC12_OWEFU|nr:unnamed protein product [Owenia fusiformis]